MFSSLEAEGQWPWDLVCSIGDVGPTRFAQMMNLGWPWPSLWQGQIWFLMHLFGKNLVLSTKCQADLWPFIKGYSFGLPHTYLNICFSEITGLFDGLFIRLFKSLDQKCLQRPYMVKHFFFFRYKLYLTLTYFNIIKEIRWAPQDLQVL